MTTIHANDAKRCLEKMSNFALRGTDRQPVRAVNTDIANAIDIIVQLIILPDGRHRIKEIREVTNTLANDEAATITTSALYTYVPKTDTFVKTSPMSDQLRARFAEKSMRVDNLLALAPGTELRGSRGFTSPPPPAQQAPGGAPSRGLPIPGGRTL